MVRKAGLIDQNANSHPVECAAVVIVQAAEQLKCTNANERAPY